MSINTPGGFEESIPQIVNYFEENPLGDAKTSTQQVAEADARREPLMPEVIRSKQRC